MAQKIGLAILALLGLANCGIYAGGSGLPYYHQVQASHRSQGGSSSGSHPELGEKEVKLGYGILSFANSEGERHGSQENSRGHEQNSGRVERNSGRHQAGSGNHGRKEQSSIRGGLRKENDSKGHGENNSNRHNEQNSNAHRNERNSPKGRSPQKVQIKVVSPPVVVVRSEHNSVQAKRQASPPKKPATVYVPVFGNLRQEENSNSGLRQASNIIVTAPLISTDKIDSHRVGYNEKVGKSNCPQCKEDKKQAAETKKSSEQAIQKDTDKLTTTIKGPIDRVEVDTVNTAPKHKHGLHHKGDKSHKHGENESSECDSSEESNSASHHSKQTRNVRYEGESINWKAVKSSLARGEERSNAQFVVGKVVFNQQDKSDDHK